MERSGFFNDYRDEWAPLETIDMRGEQAPVFVTRACFPQLKLGSLASSNHSWMPNSEAADDKSKEVKAATSPFPEKVATVGEDAAEKEAANQPADTASPYATVAASTLSDLPPHTRPGVRRRGRSKQSLDGHLKASGRTAPTDNDDGDRTSRSDNCNNSSRRYRTCRSRQVKRHGRERSRRRKRSEGRRRRSEGRRRRSPSGRRNRGTRSSSTPSTFSEPSDRVSEVSTRQRTSRFDRNEKWRVSHSKHRCRTSPASQRSPYRHRGSSKCRRRGSSEYPRRECAEYRRPRRDRYRRRGSSERRQHSSSSRRRGRSARYRRRGLAEYPRERFHEHPRGVGGEYGRQESGEYGRQEGQESGEYGRQECQESGEYGRQDSGKYPREVPSEWPPSLHNFVENDKAREALQSDFRAAELLRWKSPASVAVLGAESAVEVSKEAKTQSAGEVTEEATGKAAGEVSEEAIAQTAGEVAEEATAEAAGEATAQTARSVKDASAQTTVPHEYHFYSGLFGAMKQHAHNHYAGEDKRLVEIDSDVVRQALETWAPDMRKEDLRDWQIVPWEFRRNRKKKKKPSFKQLCASMRIGNLVFFNGKAAALHMRHGGKNGWDEATVAKYECLLEVQTCLNGRAKW